MVKIEVEIPQEILNLLGQYNTQQIINTAFFLAKLVLDMLGENFKIETNKN